ncbi:Hydroxypyruvate isomerase [Novipirellula aureliae]|uniref:Hydroxypyruvate isomerase n=2 Tax=Novipirellula aureliae TaxID=2527966 RepID=A0A5C6E1D3_9BACT|nr:Hydroxypyruvate isomerase [Novipirellula aureliae]
MSEATAKPVVNGRIKQSMAFWSFNVAGEKWDLQQQCDVAKKLGITSIEVLEPEDFPTLKKNGLVCALTSNGMPGAPFVKGLNNLAYHDEIITRTKAAIDASEIAGFPNVIAFTGYKWRDAEDPSSGEISFEEGAKNCVAGLKTLATHAEKAGVTICLEMLNTRDDTHPMKGHPGYQGDDMDDVADIIKQVGSPQVKLLFDIYHVQVMNGDVIRRIKQYADLIGHVHVAGNPGRCEIDDSQEINFPGCMKALLDIGYDGFVGQEYIPTRDAMEGLTEAVKLCDV